jgi:hypothetical protein
MERFAGADEVGVVHAQISSQRGIDVTEEVF